MVVSQGPGHSRPNSTVENKKINWGKFTPEEISSFLPWSDGVAKVVVNPVGPAGQVLRHSEQHLFRFTAAITQLVTRLLDITDMVFLTNPLAEARKGGLEKISPILYTLVARFQNIDAQRREHRRHVIQHEEAAQYATRKRWLDSGRAMFIEQRAEGERHRMKNQSTVCSLLAAAHDKPAIVILKSGQTCSGNLLYNPQTKAAILYTFTGSERHDIPSSLVADVKLPR